MAAFEISLQKMLKSYLKLESLPCGFPQLIKARAAGLMSAMGFMISLIWVNLIKRVLSAPSMERKTST